MPGILPTALFHLLPNTAFIRLPDIAPDLPKYTEIVDTMKMDDTLVPAYAELYRELYDLVSDGYASGSMKYLSTFLQSLLVYPDRCTKENPVYDPDTGKVIFEPMILSESHIYNKEKRLIELVKEEKQLGPEGSRVRHSHRHQGHHSQAANASPRAWHQSSDHEGQQALSTAS